MKELRNKARNRQRAKPVVVEPVAAEPVMSEPAPEGPVVDEQMLSHLQASTSLIEGRSVSRDEILAMLAEMWRQHGMATGRRMDYVVKRLHEEQPDD